MDTEIIHVLLIEDNPGDTRLVKEMLMDLSLMNYFEGYTFKLTSCDRLNSALSLLDIETIDIVLVDLSLPDSQGLDTVRAVCKIAPNLPIIVLSGQTETTTATLAVQEGAQDYLLKGSIDGQLLARSIRYAIERKKKDIQLQQLASFDPLTKLANRTLFAQRFTQSIAMAKRHQWTTAVLFVDLDHFKPINDNLSHKVGDLVLQTVASRLTANLQANDIIARMGGDEFVVILQKINDALSAGKVAKRILDAIKAPMHIDEKTLFVTASTGISLYPHNAEEEATLLKDADMAMYWAKNAGGDTYKFYTVEMTNELHDKIMLENELRSALQNEKFVLLYQPQIDLGKEQICGVEVSLHLKLADGYLMGTDEIASAIEELDILDRIREWIFNEALLQSNTWVKNKFKISIKNKSLNLAALPLSFLSISETIKKLSAKNGFNLFEIELEMGENLNVQALDYLMESIKILSMDIAIDNLFTPAALNCLRKFQISTVKLDKCLIADVNNKKDAAIIIGIINVAHSMGVTVAAQGVETKEQLQFLRANGCDKAQGNYICPPVNAQELPTRIQRLSNKTP
jgi:diguanylate cyclase (GGDEF)-like protein